MNLYEQYIETKTTPEIIENELVEKLPFDKICQCLKCFLVFRHSGELNGLC